MKIKKILPVVPGCIVAMLCNSNAIANIDMSNFYVGLDVLKTSYSTQEYYGRNIFAKNPTAWNAFVGYKLPRDFFIELGYEKARTKEREESTLVGKLPGVNNNMNAPIDVNTKLKLSMPYIGVGVDYPISIFNKTILSGMIGVTAVKLNLDQDDLLYNNFDRTYIKTKACPLVRVGIRHNFTKSLDLRLTATWRRLTTFQVRSKENPTGSMEIRMKNGYSFGIGLSYSL